MQTPCFTNLSYEENYWGVYEITPLKCHCRHCVVAEGTEIWRTKMKSM